jgi:hypothetical protein
LHDYAKQDLARQHRQTKFRQGYARQGQQNKKVQLKEQISDKDFASPDRVRQSKPSRKGKTDRSKSVRKRHSKTFQVTERETRQTKTG